MPLQRSKRVGATQLANNCFCFQTFDVFWVLYSFFVVVPRRLNFMRRRFGTYCLFHLYSTPYEDGTVCSETSAHKIQTPGNHPKERMEQIIVYYWLWPLLDQIPYNKSVAQNVECIKILCAKKFSVCPRRNYGAEGMVKSTNFHGYAGSMGTLYKGIKEFGSYGTWRRVVLNSRMEK